MFDFIRNIISDIHPVNVHFPVALVTTSFALAVISRFKSEFLFPSWITLVCGVLFMIPAVITGGISHIPYEKTPLHDVIEIHESLAFVTTLYFTGLLIVRWRSIRKNRDMGNSWIFLGIMALGMALLILTGGNGGNLVYQHGINVRGINPLIQK